MIAIFAQEIDAIKVYFQDQDFPFALHAITVLSRGWQDLNDNYTSLITSVYQTRFTNTISTRMGQEVMDDIVCPLCIHYHPEVAGDHFVVAPCGHFYHNECIQEYLGRGKQKCPTCCSFIMAKKLTKLYGIDPNRKLSFSNPPIVTTQPCQKEKQTYIFKIALLGSSGVGKSCLLKRFAEDTFVPNINATRGVDLVRRNVQMGDVTVQLIIWDTIGQEIFNSITSTCVRDVQGILFVYDVSKVQTLKDLQYWINFAEDYGPKDTIKILVGNQIDLKDSRKISFEEGKVVADKNNFPFFETSAKLADNVEATFRALTAKILENEWIMSAVHHRMCDSAKIRLRLDDGKDSGCLSWVRRGWQNLMARFEVSSSM